MRVLLVEHHMDLVMSGLRPDRGARLRQASIAAGTPDEVRDDPAVTEAYLGDEVAEADAPRPTRSADD